MRIFNVADIHLTELFSLEMRRTVRNAFLNSIELCREADCQVYKILGDLIHDKALFYITSLNFLHDTFLSNPDIQFEIIVGNHDCVGDPLTHGFSTLGREDNVTIISEPRETTDEFGNTLLDLPYSKNLEEILANKKADYLFGHFGVNEAIVFPGISIAHRISFANLIQFKRVFLGHYHLPQEHEFGDTWLAYVGSIASKDWSDKNQTKRALILDTETNSVENIILPNTINFYEFTATTATELQTFLAEKEQLKAAGHKVRIKTTEDFGILDDSILCYPTPSSEDFLDVSSLSHSSLLKTWVKLKATQFPDSEQSTLLTLGEDIFSQASEVTAELKKVAEKAT